MISREPTKLSREPIVDAVFEMRVEPGALPLANILPGLLVSNYKVEQVERLPAADVPQSIRDAQEQLRYQPLMRLFINDLIVNIGDRVIVIASRLPYPGWTAFKAGIVDIVGRVVAANFIKAVERYSMKYVDIVEADVAISPFDILDFNVKVAGRTLSTESVAFRTERTVDGFVEILQIISPAGGVVQNLGPRSGIVIDIDTIGSGVNVEPQAFLTSLSENLDRLHSANKSSFFGILTDDLLKKLGAQYE